MLFVTCTLYTKHRALSTEHWTLNTVHSHISVYFAKFTWNTAPGPGLAEYFLSAQANRRHGQFQLFPHVDIHFHLLLSLQQHPLRGQFFLISLHHSALDLAFILVPLEWKLFRAHCPKVLTAAFWMAHCALWRKSMFTFHVSREESPFGENFCHFLAHYLSMFHCSSYDRYYGHDGCDDCDDCDVCGFRLAQKFQRNSKKVVQCLSSSQLMCES